MKKNIIALLLSVLYIRSNAQVNLLSNPSFELKNNCPDRRANPYCMLLDTTITPASCIDLRGSSGYFDSTLVGWTSYRETPDYYNICAPNPNQGVPSNIFGSQSAKEGDAYVGITTSNFPKPSFHYVYDILGNPVWDSTIQYYASANDTLYDSFAFRETIGNKLDSNLTVGTK